MPLVIEDGYTLSFHTEPVVKSIGGDVLYDNLPVVHGLYRPPVWEERQRHLYAVQRAASVDEEINLIAAFVAARVSSWDVMTLAPADQTGISQPRLMTAKITPESIRRLPEPVVNQIYDRVSKWGAKTQAEQAGN